MSKRERIPLRLGNFDPQKFLNELNAQDHLRIIMSSHLYAESALMQIIESQLPYPDAINVDRLSFPDKLDLAVALDTLNPAERDQYLWLNRMRNKLAHNLGATVTVGDVDDLLKLLDAGQQSVLRKVIGSRAIPAQHLQHAITASITRLQLHLERSAQEPAQASSRRQRYDAWMQDEKSAQTTTPDQKG